MKKTKTLVLNEDQYGFLQRFLDHHRGTFSNSLDDIAAFEIRRQLDKEPTIAGTDSSK